MKISFLAGCLFCTHFAFAQSETKIQSSDNPVYIAKYKNGKACAISYTFDDGLKEHYTLIAPRLAKIGFKGTFWVWAKCIDNDSFSLGKPRMTWTELQEMSAQGHEISSHSWSHPNLTRLSPEMLKFEIEKNDTLIFEKLGKMPRTFCYPGNAFNDAVVQAASKNRVGTRISQFAVGSKSTAESLNKWVNELVEKGEWGVTMTHGITYGYDSFPDPSVLWNHLEKVKLQADKIWVGTFKEIAAYIKERENIQLDIIERRGSIIITPHLSLKNELFNEPLTMVIKKEGVRKVKAKQRKKKLSTRVAQDKVLLNFNPNGGTIEVKIN